MVVVVVVVVVVVAAAALGLALLMINLMVGLRLVVAPSATGAAVVVVGVGSLTLIRFSFTSGEPLVSLLIRIEVPVMFLPSRILLINAGALVLVAVVVVVLILTTLLSLGLTFLMRVVSVVFGEPAQPVTFLAAAEVCSVGLITQRARMAFDWPLSSDSTVPVICCRMFVREVTFLATTLPSAPAASAFRALAATSVLVEFEPAELVVGWAAFLGTFLTMVLRRIL